MQGVRVSRGLLMICETCYQAMKHDGVVDQHNQAVDHEILEHLCPNCYDHNKVLIDDLLGSTE
jgi:Zn finger protein HypA/HybF involved in hydrogenase expression